MEQRNQDVIIIGGGIGGPAAAFGLRQLGYDVAVYEQATALEAAGAGLTLWKNALDALREFGLWERLQAAALPDDRFARLPAIWARDGELLVAADAAEMEKRFGRALAAVHRADLQETLIQGLGAEHVTLGRRCVGFQQDADGVTVYFADGGQARAGFLVGAGGLHSPVRAQLHGDRPPRYAGYTAWRAVIPFAGDRRLDGGLRAGESWGRGARHGRLPLTNGRVYWFATRNAPEGERAGDGEKAALLETFSGWHEPVESLIWATGEGDILRNDIYDRPPLKSWGEGRVTLLGDAAHPMTPDLGQGAAQTLEDAVVLCDCVGEHGLIPAALRAYEAQRIPRTTSIVRASRLAGAVGQWSHPAAVAARRALARLLLGRLQMRQLERLLATGF